MTQLQGLSKLGALITVCFLFQLLPTPNANAVWETFTDRPGSDYKVFSISYETEQFVAVKICEDACKMDPNCKSFTYVKPGIQGKDARCYLKSAVPPPIKNECCTSGLVRPTNTVDKCKNYADTAVQQNISNINWGCGMSGAAWTSDYNAHYQWCIKGGWKEAGSHTEARIKALQTCWSKVSTSGDLEAIDWCWKKEEAVGKISFYPIIRNVGTEDWRSKQEGYYKIGVWGPATIVEKKYTLSAYPYWSLKKGETKTLDGGVTFWYHPENLYGLENIWLLFHPEDVNPGNNANAGIKGFFKGASFGTDPKLSGNECN